MSQVYPPSGAARLQQSEAVVAQCAATIYAATCPQQQGTSGQVEAGKESEWIRPLPPGMAIRAAAELAPGVQELGTDQAIHSDDERMQRDPSAYE